jgi:hypothetical protein
MITMKNVSNVTAQQEEFVSSHLPTLCFALRVEEDDLRSYSHTLTDAVYQLTKHRLQTISKVHPIVDIAHLMIVCFWLRESHLQTRLCKLIKDTKSLRAISPLSSMKSFSAKEVFIRYDQALLSILQNDDQSTLSSLMIQLEYIEHAQQTKQTKYIHA